MLSLTINNLPTMPHIEHVDLRSISTTPWFNDPVEMEKAIQTLEGLNFLLDCRGEYRQLKAAPLRNFVLGGNWAVDEFGQRGYVTVNVYRDTPPAVLKHLEKLRQEKKVLTFEEFSNEFFKFGQDVGWGRSMGGSVAPADVVCVHCQQPWTVENSSDCHLSDRNDYTLISGLGGGIAGLTLAEVREKIESETDGVAKLIMRQHNVLKSHRFIDMTPTKHDPNRPKNKDGWARSDNYGDDWPKIDWNTYVVQVGDQLYFDRYTFIHSACRIDRATKSARLKIENAFREAGIVVSGSVAVPNHRGTEAYGGKWFIVDTDKGLFYVGWRKSVMFCQQQKHWIDGDFSRVLIGFEKDGPERHLSSYEHLTTYLRTHFVVKTTATESIEVSQEVVTKLMKMGMVVTMPVENTVPAIEKYLEMTLGLNFEHNADNNVTVDNGAIPDWMNPNGWEKAHVLRLDGKPIGYISGPLAN